MNHLFKLLTVGTLALFTTAAFAVPPKYLITHNTTDVESNAFVAGTIPSQHPTKAHSDGKVFWTAVKMVCFGHSTNGQCSALIMMETNTANPIPLGYVNLNLDSGDINPKQLSANGYTLIVNGPGETTLIKN